MNDFYDNFDDFDEGEFMDDDSFEDGFDENFESEDLSNDDSGIEEEPTGDDMCEDDIAMEDAVFIGGTMMGWAYEEGLEEGRRRKLEKKMNADRGKRDREDDAGE